MTRQYLFFYLFLLTAWTVRAQPYFDLCNYTFLKSPVKPELNGVSSALNYQTAFINIPLKSDSNFTVITSAFEHLDFKLRNQIDFSVSSFRFTVSRIQKWKRNWQTAFVVNLRSNTDHAIFRNENYQVGGAIVFVKKLSHRFKYSFGLYYNREFFGHFFVPLAGVNWKISEKCQAYGLIPNTFNFNYKLLPWVHTGISFAFITSSYRLEEMKYLRFNDNQVKVFLNFILAKRNILFAEAGHSLYRKIKSGTGFYSGNGEMDLNVSDSWLVKIGYAYRIFE